MKALLLFWLTIGASLPLPASEICLNELVQRLLRDPTHHVPHYLDVVDRTRPSGLYVMSHTQSTVDEFDKIETMKRDMREGNFLYESPEGRLGGHYYERRRVFFVGEGHHRLAAALEIAREDGDWRPFRQLIRHGLWEKIDRLPANRYRLPVRSTWSSAWGWRNFLRPLTP
jgi:hypothetical protein